MVMSIRHIELGNTTAAAIAVGGASTQVGQDYTSIVTRRTLAVADVGTNPGQIRHAQGMLMAEVYGGIIKGVISLEVFRPTGANGFFNKFNFGTVTANNGYSIVTDARGVSTLRFRDAAGGDGILAANDLVVMVLEVGNS